MINFIISNEPWFWLGIMIICIIVEACTMAFTTIWAAIAAFPMIFISRTGLPFKWQLLIFVAVTVCLVIFTRPFAIKKLKIGKYKTNVNTMVGEDVLVTKEISKFQRGEAKSKNGVIWTARASDDSEITEGSVCTIMKVEGNTLVISKKADQEA